MNEVLEKAGFGELYRELHSERLLSNSAARAADRPRSYSAASVAAEQNYHEIMSKGYAASSPMSDDYAVSRQMKEGYAASSPMSDDYAASRPDDLALAWFELPLLLLGWLLLPFRLLGWLLRPFRLLGSLLGNLLLLLWLFIGLVTSLLLLPGRFFGSATIEITEPAPLEELHDVSVPIRTRAELAYTQVQKHFTLIRWFSGVFAVFFGVVAISFFIAALALYWAGNDQLGLGAAIVSGSTFLGEVVIRPWKGWLDAVKQTSQVTVAFDGYLDEKAAGDQDVDSIRAAVSRFIENMKAIKA